MNVRDLLNFRQSVTFSSPYSVEECLQKLREIELPNIAKGMRKFLAPANEKKHFDRFQITSNRFEGSLHLAKSLFNNWHSPFSSKIIGLVSPALTGSTITVTFGTVLKPTWQYVFLGAILFIACLSHRAVLPLLAMEGFIISVFYFLFLLEFYTALHFLCRLVHAPVPIDPRLITIMQQFNLDFTGKFP